MPYWLNHDEVTDNTGTYIRVMVLSEIPKGAIPSTQQPLFTLYGRDLERTLRRAEARVLRDLADAIEKDGPTVVSIYIAGIFRVTNFQGEPDV
jgi:hypothetical protein